MIPTMLLFGHWWRAVVLVGTLGWPILLIAAGPVRNDVAGCLVAAALAFVNTAAGAAVHQAVFRGLRVVRRSRAASR